MPERIGVRGVKRSDIGLIPLDLPGLVTEPDPGNIQCTCRDIEHTQMVISRCSQPVDQQRSPSSHIEDGLMGAYTGIFQSNPVRELAPSDTS